MTYRVDAISMTLNHLQGHSYCKPFKCLLMYVIRSHGASHVVA